MAGKRMALVALAALSALALASALEPNQAYAVAPFYDFTTPVATIPVQTVKLLSKATIRWSFQATDKQGQYYTAPISGMDKIFKTKLPPVLNPIPNSPITSGIQILKAPGTTTTQSPCAKAASSMPIPQSRIVTTPPTGLKFDATTPAYYTDLKAPAVKGCYWVNLWWYGTLTCRALIQVV